MATYYLVVEDGWEYNDEYYERGNNDDYTIKSKLIRDKKEAEKIAEEKNDKCEKDGWLRNSNDKPIRPFKVIKVED